MHVYGFHGRLLLTHTVVETDPINHGLPGHRWTLKKLRRWLEQVIGYACSRTTLNQVQGRLLRRVLRSQRLSWKKCQKVLKKADPQRRAAFVQQLQALFTRLCRQEIRLLYIDEAHLHRDMDLGYTPGLTGGLWKWMREEVTRNFCHASMRHLFDACKAFIDRINVDPQRLVSRLWPRFDLDPAFEKFLISM